MARSHFTTWHAFTQAHRLAKSTYHLTRTFPKEERYALTDQLLRSSRSVCTNLAEGYAKRRYPRHFIAKVTDAAGENNETQVWLRFAFDHGYISKEYHTKYHAAWDRISRLLHFMENNPDHCCLPRK
jgi:four helix bundle protein